MKGLLRTKKGLLFCAAAVFIASRVFINETGFCSSKLKFMTNDDIRRALIENEIPNIWLHTGKFKVTEHLHGKYYTFDRSDENYRKVNAYKTIDEFLYVNPECCNIPGEFDDFGAPPIYLFRYLSGWTSTTNWAFREKYIDTDGNISKTESLQGATQGRPGAFYVSNCGNIDRASYPYNNQ